METQYGNQAKDWMSRRLITVGADDPLSKCYELMRDHNIRHLPVIDRHGHGNIIGILSDRDLQRALVHEGDAPELISDESGYVFEEGQTAQDHMSWPVRTISDESSLQTAATQMLREKISAFLVSNAHGQITGILTTDDLLKMLVDLLRRQPQAEQITLRSFDLALESENLK